MEMTAYTCYNVVSNKHIIYRPDDLEFNVLTSTDFRVLMSVSNSLSHRRNRIKFVTELTVVDVKTRTNFWQSVT